VVIRNAISLFVPQLITLLVPFLLLPFLSRLLSKEDFGTFVYAQSLGIWISLIVEYGFNFSATRYISQNLKNRDAVRLKITNIVGAKLLLSVIACLFLALFLVFFPSLAADPLIVFGIVFMAIGQGWNPSWYYQGTQKITVFSILDSTARLLSILLTYLVTQFTQNSGAALLSMSIGISVSAIFGLLDMKHSYPFREFKVKDIFVELSDSFQMFLYRIFSSFYTTANIVIIGFIVSPTLLTNYAISERLVGFCTATYWPIWRAVYPKTSVLVKESVRSAKSWMRKVLVFFYVAGLALSLFLYFFGIEIINIIFGTSFQGAYEVLRILCFSVFMVSISGTLGLQWLVPLGLEKVLNLITIGSGILNVTLMALFVPHYSVYGAALVLVFVETMVVISLLVFVRLKNIML
jgi:polysaccharide transporter, PST family